MCGLNVFLFDQMTLGANPLHNEVITGAKGSGFKPHSQHKGRGMASWCLNWGSFQQWLPGPSMQAAAQVNIGTFGTRET